MQVAVRTRVYIVEDSPSIRERLLEMLSSQGISVVGEAESPAEAIAGIRRLRPDCVVLDLKLLGGSGIEVLHELHPEFPEMTFIVLSNHADPPYRRRCEAAGARFFLDKSTEFARITDLITGLDPVRSSES
jgi:DNA-binding NarL/FixJ family response regulator